jgi:hypothetical protein
MTPESFYKYSPVLLIIAVVSVVLSLLWNPYIILVSILMLILFFAGIEYYTPVGNKNWWEIL